MVTMKNKFEFRTVTDESLWSAMWNLYADFVLVHNSLMHS